MPYLGREPQGILANTIEGNLKVTGTISADSINDKLALNGSDTSSPQSNANDQIVLEADTFTNLNASSTESGAIQKLFISAHGMPVGIDKPGPIGQCSL